MAVIVLIWPQLLGIAATIVAGWLDSKMVIGALTCPSSKTSTNDDPPTANMRPSCAKRPRTELAPGMVENFRVPG